MKRFYIDNHGCAKNQVDAEEIIARLGREGWELADTPEEAGLVIVNSCGFIENAKKESLEAVMAFRATWPDKRILLAGCLSQRYAKALDTDLSEADGIFGNGDLSLIGSAADAALAGRRRSLAPGIRPYTPIRRERLTGFPGLAYLKIAEGCSNRCSFCAIPLIRGDLSSRDPDDVAREFEELIIAGVWEVCLIGQDLGSYGLDRAGRPLLPELLDAVSGLSGDFRLRMLYIHPDHFPMAILDACGQDSRIAPYFDLPFQHGSASILKAMNRSGNADTYLHLLSDIRATVPKAVIRSTLLTGFPGETEADFADLRRFQDKARLDWLGAFPYSREEDTPAYGMKGRVPKKTAEARKKAVEEAQRPITEAALDRFSGTVQTVLVEEQMEGEDLAIARGYMNAPEVDGSIVVVGSQLRAGERVDVRITAVRGVDLEAVRAG
ncbi:MAG: 30S ribosomal protein S12 methylthiotransferase RimO [Spirochaetota bacterium]